MNSLNRPSRKEIGRSGEQEALDYFKRKGFRVLEQNWRCRRGEIDLILSQDETVIFVEVRTRLAGHSLGAPLNFGTPQESIDARKQLQVRAIAAMYIHYRGWHDRAVRFDAVCILLKPDKSVESFDHIQEAF
jgi:putative endonuclease